MKMQVLYFSKNGMAQQLAYAVSTELQCKCDNIPPAFPPETEKVIFIGMEAFSAPAKNIVEFCKTLNPSRTKNVAFFTVAKDDSPALDSLKAMLTANGVKVVENNFNCVVKRSFFKSGNITADDLANIKTWASAVVESLKQ
ncbi:MAG: hypothetical protein IJF27_02400 [Oscillospiraceae bacterium]|nr:hypothetical protein [Oscillospiraceae bacterium]MBQ3048801.1 hypothetical protein [Oscillospiraceae bacterium]MBQ9938770.1 hypothetical protein [Oscillospiraceae bacterium]